MKKICSLICICFFLGIGAVLPAWGFEGFDFPKVKKEAEQGDPDAQSKMGVMYATGIGAPMNKKVADKWYKKAADQGEPISQWNLAFMYVRGEGGLEVNYTEARKLFLMSAQRGFSSAQYDLGIVLLDGVGGEPNRDEAITWFKRAAAQGNRDAKKILKELGEQVPSVK